MTDDKPPLPSLDELQRKIDAVSTEGTVEPSETDSRQGIGKAINLATELMAGVGVGGVMGYGIDSVLGTLPIFFIGFFFLGFAAGLRNMLRNFAGPK